LARLIQMKNGGTRWHEGQLLTRIPDPRTGRLKVNVCTAVAVGERLTRFERVVVARPRGRLTARGRWTTARPASRWCFRWYRVTGTGEIVTEDELRERLTAELDPETRAANCHGTVGDLITDSMLVGIYERVDAEEEE
jgi:hypothetical protein